MKSILIYISIVNVITFFVFGLDKQLAIKNKWRIPERTLYLLVLFGGTIAGLAAMHVFTHKTKKTSFILVIYSILILQLVLLYFEVTMFKNIF